MMGEAFDLVSPAQPFKRYDNSGMEFLPSLVQQAPIDYFLCKGVFEGIGHFGKQARLVEELDILEVL
jgi:hypothetical protein